MAQEFLTLMALYLSVDFDELDILEMTEGSTVTTISASGDAVSATDGVDVTDIASTSTGTNFQVISSSSALYYDDERMSGEEEEEEKEEASNIGMIVGIVVGVIAAFAVTAFIIYKVKKAKSSPTTGVEQDTRSPVFPQENVDFKRDDTGLANFKANYA